jgi:hypothetical protein
MAEPTWVHIDWPLFDQEDVLIAIKAAQVMANRWGDDAAIMQDLKVVKLRDAQEPPLEIVRCEAQWRPTFG